METTNSHFDSYLAVEQKIQQGELSLSEVEHLLEALLRQQRLTLSEQETLLALAWKVKIDHESSVKQ